MSSEKETEQGLLERERPKQVLGLTQFEQSCLNLGTSRGAGHFICSTGEKTRKGVLARPALLASPGAFISSAQPGTELAFPGILPLINASSILSMRSES